MVAVLPGHAVIPEMSDVLTQIKEEFELDEHSFVLRYVQPGSFENVSDEERQKYGGILDRYYAYVDAEVGRAIEGLTPGDLLLVVSGFGMQPVDMLLAQPFQDVIGNGKSHADATRNSAAKSATKSAGRKYPSKSQATGIAGLTIGA